MRGVFGGLHVAPRVAKSRGASKAGGAVAPKTGSKSSRAGKKRLQEPRPLAAPVWPMPLSLSAPPAKRRKRAGGGASGGPPPGSANAPRERPSPAHLQIVELLGRAEVSKALSLLQQSPKDARTALPDVLAALVQEGRLADAVKALQRLRPEGPLPHGAALGALLELPQSASVAEGAAFVEAVGGACAWPSQEHEDPRAWRAGGGCGGSGACS